MDQGRIPFANFRHNYADGIAFAADEVTLQADSVCNSVPWQPGGSKSWVRWGMDFAAGRPVDDQRDSCLRKPQVFGERPQTDALPCWFSHVRGGS